MCTRSDDRKSVKGEVMQFRELEVNALFTFHSFSKEVWQKVSETECLCVSYENEQVDSPWTLEQRVFPYTKEVVIQKETEQVDNFQPITLIHALRLKMKEVKENKALSNAIKEGIRLGLAWSIVEIQEQATAVDRFTPKGD